MDLVTVFHASAVRREELGGILAEHLALERLRVFRRLLVVRFARAIAVMFVAGAGLGWLPRPAWLASVVVFSGTGAWVWLTERRRERHLNRRLQGVPPGASARAVAVAAVMTVPDGRHEALYRG